MSVKSQAKVNKARAKRRAAAKKRRTREAQENSRRIRGAVEHWRDFVITEVVEKIPATEALDLVGFAPSEDEPGTWASDRHTMVLAVGESAPTWTSQVVVLDDEQPLRDPMVGDLRSVLFTGLFMLYEDRISSAILVWEGQDRIDTHRGQMEFDRMVGDDNLERWLR